MKISSKSVLLLNFISIASVSAAIITPALPQIETTYHLERGAVEWVVSIFLIGYMVGQLIYGPLANRWGRIKALQIGLLLNLVGIALCMLALHYPSYSLLLFGRLITALGSASGLVCTFILINEILPKEEAKTTISYTIISFSLGIAVAVFVGGLITQYLNWSDCFSVLMLHGIILLLCTRFLKETLLDTDHQSIQPLTLIKKYYQGFRHKALVGFSIIIGSGSVYAYTVSTAAPLIASDYLKIGPGAYGTWNLLNTVGMLIGGFMAARLLRDHGGMKTIVVGLIIMATGIVSLLVFWFFQSKSPLWFFLTSSVMYIGSGQLFSCGSYYASNAITDRSSASAIMNFLNVGSAVLGVSIMGYLPVNPLISFMLVCGLFILIATVMRFVLHGYKPV